MELGNEKNEDWLVRAKGLADLNIKDAFHWMLLNHLLTSLKLGFYFQVSISVLQRPSPCIKKSKAYLHFHVVEQSQVAPRFEHGMSLDPRHWDTIISYSQYLMVHVHAFKENSSANIIFAPSLDEVQLLTNCILVDSSNVICWTRLFVILGVSDLFCRFYFNRVSK